MDATISQLNSSTPLEKFVSQGKVDGVTFSVAAYRETNMMSNRLWVTINIKNDNVGSLTEEQIEAICRAMATRVKEADDKNNAEDRIAFAERTPGFVVSVMSQNFSFKI